MPQPRHQRETPRRRRLLHLVMASVLVTGVGFVLVTDHLAEASGIRAAFGTLGATVAPDDDDASAPAPTTRPAQPTESVSATPRNSRGALDRRVPPAQRVVEGVTLRVAEQTGPSAEEAAGLAAAAQGEADGQNAAPFSVRVGSFNVLGSQHTAPGGDRRRYPPASTRSAGAVTMIAEHGVDILGTQELQGDQLRTLQARTGMAAYPGWAWGQAETDNSVLWDPSRFELVSGERFTIPFMGRPRPQPIVRLRELATGRELYVVNTHPSARDGRYLVERRQGQAALVDVVSRLKATGLPVLVTGDMNDREEFFCRVVAPAALVAANGGSYASGCQPPPSPIPVDWVVGSGVTFSKYWRDTRPVTRRISDHFFISATAYVP